ncbi:MAG: DUF6600 domain-containing protein [Thermodesulfobacteriota bacterium]
MKHKVMVFVLALALFAGVGMMEYEEKAHADTAFSFGLFYNSLGAYGSWVPISGYGYGWYPTGVGPGWQPYLNGQWVWTDQGWAWSSYEPWGWATYHYGRWIYDSYYGWTWIPGTTWAPAYVSWYQAPGYYGWSPLPPDNNFFIEIGISFVDYDYGYYGPYYGGYGGYYGGNYGYKHWKHKKGHYYDNDYYAPGEHCVFVPEDKFTNRNAKLVALDNDHKLTVMRNVKNVTNIKAENNKIYNFGPEKSNIERAVKGKLQPANLVDSDLADLRAGRNGKNLDGNNYKVFRPSIEKKEGETPFNSQGFGNKNIWTTRDNKNTGTKNSLTDTGDNKGNGLVQKRDANTGRSNPFGKNYGNAAPDDYGVIKKDTGRLKSGAQYETPKRGKTAGDTFIPANKPDKTDRKPSTVTNRKNNAFNDPSMYDNQSGMKSNVEANDRLKQNRAPAAKQKPVDRNPYGYQPNNYQPNNKSMNRYPKPGQGQAYKRTQAQPRSNYNPYQYNVQKQQPQYRQSQPRQSKTSVNRKSSGSDNNRYINSSPRQYTSPTRNFSPGNARSYNSNSFVKGSGNR